MRRGVSQDVGESAGEVAGEVQAELGAAEREGVDVARGRAAVVGVAERAAGDVDESVGRRQREDDDQELSRPWSELSAKAEAQLKESFVAFREAVEQAREAVDSAESMISAAERADSGALSQRPAQGVEASHVEDVESGEALSARQTDEAAQLSGQLDQVKRSVEDARRVIDGQELDARRDVAQARQSDQADQAALDAARNLKERAAEVTRTAADTAALAEHRDIDQDAPTALDTDADRGMRRGVAQDVGESAGEVAGEVQAELGAAEREGVDVARGRAAVVGVAERAAGDVDESVGRRQREDDDQELSRPWSELSAKAEAQLKESFVAFREAVEQAREAVDSAESMISAAERADSGALSQRPAQGVEASHVEDVESGEALSARQTDEAAQLSGQLDQVKRSVEDARRVIDGQELDARRDVAQARQSDQADQAALDAARNLKERAAEVTRTAAGHSRAGRTPRHRPRRPYSSGHRCRTGGCGGGFAGCGGVRW